MAVSQPLSAAPCGAEYLRAILRAPVYEVAQVTPLQVMEKISSRVGNTVLVKREDRQPVHSFKLRGAYAMISSLTEEQKACGVVTASAGNHAQGVALSAHKMGIKALIVMPVATADIKLMRYVLLAARCCCLALILMKPKPKLSRLLKSRATPLCHRLTIRR